MQHQLISVCTNMGLVAGSCKPAWDSRVLRMVASLHERHSFPAWLIALSYGCPFIVMRLKCHWTSLSMLNLMASNMNAWLRAAFTYL